MHPTYHPVRPEVTSITMRLSDIESCGQECFRFIDDSYAVNSALSMKQSSFTVSNYLQGHCALGIA